MAFPELEIQNSLEKWDEGISIGWTGFCRAPLKSISKSVEEAVSCQSECVAKETSGLKTQIDQSAYRKICTHKIQKGFF